MLPSGRAVQLRGSTPQLIDREQAVGGPGFAHGGGTQSAVPASGGLAGASGDPAVQCAAVNLG